MPGEKKSRILVMYHKQYQSDPFGACYCREIKNP